MASENSVALAAQVWCDDRCSNKVMDVELATVFAETLDEMRECLTTGRGMNEVKAGIMADGLCVTRWDPSVSDRTFAEMATELAKEGGRGGPWLGLATTRELLEEITARTEMDGRMDYRTVDIDEEATTLT